MRHRWVRFFIFVALMIIALNAITFFYNPSVKKPFILGPQTAGATCGPVFYSPKLKTIFTNFHDPSAKIPIRFSHVNQYSAVIPMPSATDHHYLNLWFDSKGYPNQVKVWTAWQKHPYSQNLFANHFLSASYAARYVPAEVKKLFSNPNYLRKEKARAPLQTADAILLRYYPYHLESVRWMLGPAVHHRYVAARNHNLPVLICQANFYHKNSHVSEIIYPGELKANGCAITYAGKSFIRQPYALLTTKAPELLLWVKPNQVFSEPGLIHPCDLGMYIPPAPSKSIHTHPTGSSGFSLALKVLTVVMKIPKYQVGIPILGGFEGNHYLYVCKARYKNRWHVGKVVTGVCDIAWHGQEISLADYRVLVIKRQKPQRPFSWLLKD